MINICLKLHCPTRSIRVAEGSFCSTLMFDGYFTSDFSVQDGDRYEDPGSATVIFDEALSDSDARLEYERGWKDPDTGEIHRGVLRLYFPLNQVTDRYIREHNFSEHPLVLSALIESVVKGEIAIIYMGPDGEGEHHWNSSIATRLKASFQWMAPDARAVSWSEPIKETDEQSVLESVPWQREATEMHFEALRAQRANVVEIEKVLRQTNKILMVIAVLVIVCGVANHF